MKKILFVFILFISVSMLISCNNATNKNSEEKDTTQVYKKIVPDWTKDAVIYEVNIRHFSPEGTFNAFRQHLPRLKELGVDILWIMPLHPVGLKNRKQNEKDLGSPYSVQNYLAVNPDYGTMDDFKQLVTAAHEAGLYVIIDWVANHTSWDNVWVETNPEFYTKNKDGEMMVPEGTDWDDTADLNYENDSLRKAMTEALKFWVKETDIDGYRCDVAGMVPVTFWDSVRMELDKIKPVFMLAEAEEPPLHENAFDMGYAWSFHHIMNHIAQKKKDVSEIDNYFSNIEERFPKPIYLMYFTTNHDENAWKGTIKERMGDAGDAMNVLTFTVPGMPLIHTGQEVAIDKKLSFFGKDEIDWQRDTLKPMFYQKLTKLKKDNPALWNGEFGGDLVRINTNKDKEVYAFIRQKDENKVFVVLNLTDIESEISLQGNSFTGTYTDYFENKEIQIDENSKFTLPAWGYKVFVSK